jgi:hypothetical protein
MTVVELKKSLHEKIDGLDDPQLLKHVAEIIDSMNEVFIVPKHMKMGIKQGKEDIKNGRVHSMEDFDKKYEKWLKE